MLMTSKMIVRPGAKGASDQSALRRITPVTDGDIEAIRRLGAFRNVVQRALADHKPTPILLLKGPASDSLIFGICKGYDGYLVRLQTPDTEIPGFSVIGDRNPELEAERIGRFRQDVFDAASGITDPNVLEAIETMRRNKLKMFLPVHQLATAEAIARLVGLERRTATEAQGDGFRLESQ